MMVLRLALRYSFSSSNRHRGSSFRIALSIALSVAVLLSVISIMDYLQGTRISGIREVRSFDAVIAGDLSEDIIAEFPYASVFTYAEEDALVGGNAYSVRFIDSSYDGGIIMDGDLSGIVVPYSYPAEEVAAVMLSRGKSGAMLPQNLCYSVTGRYRSMMGYEFDSFHMFLPLSLYCGEDVMTAVKGIDDRDAELLEEKGFDVMTWKEAEAGLYSALLIEKVMMYLVLSLLFAVILVSLRSSVRIFFDAKRQERAELEVLGMSCRMVNASLALSFLIVIAIGLSAGLCISFAAIPAAEGFIRSSGLRGATLAIPYGTFGLFSFVLIVLSLLIAFNEGARYRHMDLKEVLFNE